MSEKALPPLDLTGPASQVAERWRKWKRAFEYFAEGKGIDNVRKIDRSIYLSISMGILKSSFRN